MAMLASRVSLRENKKNPATKCYQSDHWTWDLSHLDLMLSSLSFLDTCILEDLDILVAMFYWF